MNPILCPFYQKELRARAHVPFKANAQIYGDKDWNCGEYGWKIVTQEENIHTKNYSNK